MDKVAAAPVGTGPALVVVPAEGFLPPAVSNKMARSAQVVLTVSVLALATVATAAEFEPVVAHFRLVSVFRSRALGSVVPTAKGLVVLASSLATRIFAVVASTIRLRLRREPLTDDVCARPCVVTIVFVVAVPPRGAGAVAVPAAARRSAAA